VHDPANAAVVILEYRASEPQRPDTDPAYSIIDDCRFLLSKKFRPTRTFMFFNPNVQENRLNMQLEIYLT